MGKEQDDIFKGLPDDLKKEWEELMEKMKSPEWKHKNLHRRAIELEKRVDRLEGAFNNLVQALEMDGLYRENERRVRRKRVVCDECEGTGKKWYGGLCDECGGEGGWDEYTPLLED